MPTVSRNQWRNAIAQAFRHPGQARKFALPRLVALEDRAVPTTFTVTNLADSGGGSLRAAITAANGAMGADTVQFAVAGTIALTTGQLSITDALTIQGAGRVTVSGSDASRVFHVASGTTASISGLTITRGRADQTAATLQGVGGGILNQGNLTLTNVVVSNNRAVGNAAVVTMAGGYVLFGAALGGGVANLGTLAVSGGAFGGNQALGASGTVGLNFPNIVFPGMGLGGGIYNLLSTATVTGSRFDDNLAAGGDNCTGSYAGLGGGGAIYNDATLSVSSSQFLGNQGLGGDNCVADIHPGHGVGGAVASGSVQALFATRSASLVVTASTFVRNQAAGGDGNRITTPVALVSQLDGPSDAFGGAVFAYQGTASVTGSSLVQNRAVGGAGGGDQKGSIGGGGAVIFLNFVGGVTGSLSGCSIVSNEAVGGAAGAAPRGGDALGGGVLMGGLGGAFAGRGAITIDRTSLVSNVATGGVGGSGLGGGLYNDADSALSLVASLIAANQAKGGVGGQGIGGGLYNLGTYTNLGTLIVGNLAATSNNNVFG